MNIDEAKFKVLEQNLQALTQAVYKIIYSLSDLKLLLAQQKVLVHPEEKSDIPKHSLFAQVKLFLEREGFEIEATESKLKEKDNLGLPDTRLNRTAEEAVVHTEPAKTCKACERNRRVDSNRPVPPGCRGDYYGAL
jgi:hypothetical protein